VVKCCVASVGSFFPRSSILDRKFGDRFQTQRGNNARRPAALGSGD
jgi:hypothetical protein